MLVCVVTLKYVVDCSRSELKKVTDIFTRMFHDPHGKVFSVFLDSLVQLVLVHHNDMSDWLYVLLTRLLTKTGADMLGSVHAKVQRALDVVRSVRLLVSFLLFFVYHHHLDDSSRAHDSLLALQLHSFDIWRDNKDI